MRNSWSGGEAKAPSLDDRLFSNTWLASTALPVRCASGGVELRTQMLACERLELTDPSQVGYLLRLRLVEGTPLLLETVTFPALCPVLLDLPMAQADDPGAASFYEVLRRQTNMQVTSTHKTFRPTLVAGYEARLLSISPGTPVFEIERTNFGESSKRWNGAEPWQEVTATALPLISWNPIEEGDIGG